MQYLTQDARALFDQMCHEGGILQFDPDIELPVAISQLQNLGLIKIMDSGSWEVLGMAVLTRAGRDMAGLPPRFGLFRAIGAWLRRSSRA